VSVRIVIKKFQGLQKYVRTVQQNYFEKECLKNNQYLISNN